jgi:hypothetical protein
MHGKVFQLDIKPKKSGRKDGRFPTFRGGPQLSFEKQKREHGKEKEKKGTITTHNQKKKKKIKKPLS